MNQRPKNRKPNISDPTTWQFLRRSIRKADIVLFLILLLLGIALAAASLLGRSRGAEAVIRVNGEIYGSYPLSVSRTITIRRGSHRNVVRIRNGKVFMASASCHNQICVHHKPISETNQSIVCLPNRVSVEIRAAGKEGKIDVYS